MEQVYICKYIQLYNNGTWDCPAEREAREIDKSYVFGKFPVTSLHSLPRCPSDVKCDDDGEIICCEFKE